MPQPTSQAKQAATTVSAGALGLSSILLGLVSAPLPARWRRRFPLLEQSAWPDVSIASAVLQIVLSLGLFALGYLAWMNGQLADIDRHAATVGHEGAFNPEETMVVSRALLLANPILPFIYAFTNVGGFIFLLSFLGGFVRTCHGAITKEVMPDPTLGLIDFAARKLQGKAAHEIRERGKDRSPDRLILGDMRADGFAIVIETSKDFDWREGNTIIVANTWYRLKSRGETRTATGLRVRYVLEEMPVGVAVRGMRHYDPGHAPVIVRADELRAAGTAG